MLSIKTTRDTAGKLLTATVVPGYDPAAENRNDWKTFEAADEVAKALGSAYIATDAGPYVSPRYDVIALPQVGDDVSYAFNGDSYPCGKVTKVSAFPHRRIEARDEAGRACVFYRRKQTGAWVMDGTWSLQAGHVNKRNPEF